MVTFQQAYEAAASRYAPEKWASLSPSEITQVIYEEMRRLDAEVAAGWVQIDQIAKPANGYLFRTTIYSPAGSLQYDSHRSLESARAGAAKQAAHFGLRVVDNTGAS